MASDDFVFPGLFDAFNRLVLVLVLPAFWINLRQNNTDEDRLDELLILYVASALVVFSLNMFASLFLSWHSAKGVVWDPEERTHRAWVGPALTTTLILTVLEANIDICKLAKDGM